MKFQSAALLGILITLAACGGGSNSQQTSPPPPTMIAAPSTPLTQLSTDTFTNPGSQHATEVEASAFSSGSTIVAAFQVGRIFGGGGSDIGFATSTDAGATWTHDFLPGITKFFANGTFDAASDAVVAFDAAHGVWMISSLAIANVDQVVVSRSPDGIQWGNPAIVSATPSSDKNWITCDNTATSPFYGHCYLEWDDPSNRDLIWMSASTDGGLTWGPARNTLDRASGIGGQPVVQPSGKVIVPIDGVTAQMLAFTSSDGGTTWSSSVALSLITDHQVAANLRTSSLPSAAIDAAGKVFVIWQDCRFRTACTANDLVISTSTDGAHWTTPARIPIDALTSTIDHFIPGLAVEPGTSGSSAHLALTYYLYQDANCDASTCALYTGFISSPNGGNSWTTPITLAGPMSPAWLPNTFAGLMVGDYVSTAYAGGKAFAIFAAAKANSGTLFDEPMYTTTTGLENAEGIAALTAVGEQPEPSAQSDHPQREFYDQEHRYRMSPPEN